MAVKQTTLELVVEYDDGATDPEALASALDRLVETAVSTPGILSEYGNPRLGAFTTVELPASAVPEKGGAVCLKCGAAKVVVVPVEVWKFRCGGCGIESDVPTEIRSPETPKDGP